MLSFTFILVSSSSSSSNKTESPSEKVDDNRSLDSNTDLLNKDQKLNFNNDVTDTLLKKSDAEKDLELANQNNTSRRQEDDDQTAQYDVKIGDGMDMSIQGENGNFVHN